MTTIRPAVLEDLDRIVAMGERFIAETLYVRFGSSPQGLEWTLRMVLEHGVGFLAVTEDGTIVGMIGAIAAPHPWTGTMFADEIVWWVEPEHRHGFTGPRLLGALQNWATRKGLSYLRMVAPAGSTVSTFLERRGYELVESAYIKELTPDGSTDDNAPAGRPGRSRRSDSSDHRGEQAREGGS